MVSSVYEKGFANGVTIRGVPILNTHAGNVFWVDSGIGADNSTLAGNGGKLPTNPWKTINFAIGQCKANNGDIIMVAPGHSESITAASGIDFDVAGVTLVGLGTGSSQAKITWDDGAATLVVDVDDVRIYGMHMVASNASVLEMIDVGAVNGFEIHNCLIEDESSSLEFLEAISFAASASGVRITGNTIIGRSVDNDAAISFEGACDDVHIIGNNIIYNAVQGTTVALINTESDSALTSAVIKNNVLVSQSATMVAALISTGTASTNTGMLAYNLGGVLDTNATATEDPWEVTGMALVENRVSDTVDTQGWLVPVIGATG